MKKITALTLLFAGCTLTSTALLSAQTASTAAWAKQSPSDIASKIKVYKDDFKGMKVMKTPYVSMGGDCSMRSDKGFYYMTKGKNGTVIDLVIQVTPASCHEFTTTKIKIGGIGTFPVSKDKVGKNDTEKIAWLNLGMVSNPFAVRIPLSVLQRAAKQDLQIKVIGEKSDITKVHVIPASYSKAALEVLTGSLEGKSVKPQSFKMDFN